MTKRMSRVDFSKVDSIRKSKGQMKKMKLDSDVGLKMEREKVDKKSILLS